MIEWNGEFQSFAEGRQRGCRCNISCRLFETWGPATGEARLPIVGSLKGGTTGKLTLVDRRACLYIGDTNNRPDRDILGCDSIQNLEYQPSCLVVDALQNVQQCIKLISSAISLLRSERRSLYTYIYIYKPRSCILHYLKMAYWVSEDRSARRLSTRGP